MKRRLVLIMLAIYSMVSVGLFGMGGHEMEKTLNRLSFSEDGNRVFFGAKGSLYALDLTSLEITLLGAGSLSSASYTGTNTVSVAAYLDAEDKTRIEGNFSPLLYSELSSGIVLRSGGLDVTRFVSDGFCYGPIYLEATKKVFYVRSTMTKTQFLGTSSTKQLKTWEIYERSLDGGAEKQVTALGSTLVLDLHVTKTGFLTFISYRPNFGVSIYSLDVRDGVAKDLRLINPNQKIGTFTFGVDDDSDSLVMIEREPGSGKDIPHQISKVSLDGKRNELGLLIYNPSGLVTTDLMGLAANSSAQKIVFFLQYPGNSGGELPYRDLFLVNYDGTEFRRIELDFDRMRAAIEPVAAPAN